MDWFLATLAIIFSILIYTGGVLYLRRDLPYVRWFGVLSILFAIYAVFLIYVLSSGYLLLSPEFGLLMARGDIGFYTILLVVLFIVMAPFVGLQIARTAVGDRSYGWLLLVLSVAAVLGSIIPMYSHVLNQHNWFLFDHSIPGIDVSDIAFSPYKLLNPDDPPRQQIHVYQLWWAPLMLSVVACAVVAVLACLNIRARSFRIKVITAVIIVGLGFYALQDDAYEATTFIGKFLVFLVELLMTWPIGAISIMALTWIVVAEAILPGDMRPLTQWDICQRLRGVESPIRSGCAILWQKLVSIVVRMVAQFRLLVTAQTWPAAILKVLVTIIVLIILSEIPNEGKTLIYPVTIVAKKDVVPERIEQAISDEILHSLNTLNRDLHPDTPNISQDITNINTKPTLVADENDRRQEPLKVVAPTGADLDGFAKVSDLEIGGVKIPIGMLAEPIQGPMRNRLGVKVVRGSLQIETGHYHLLAHSNRGDSWSASVEQGDDPDKVVSLLADEFALQFMQTERPDSTPKSMAALVSFREGLSSWKRYVSQNHPQDLRSAINNFRIATREDPEFGQAHYQLGLAFLADGEPGAATQALRDAIANDPKLIAAHLALAKRLITADEDYYYTPAAASSEQNDGKPDTVPLEASTLLYGIIDKSAFLGAQDIAPAYYGLCTISYKRNNFLQAYYYCKQAESIFKKISTEKAAKETTNSNIALVLNQLGILMEGLGEYAQVDSPEWLCSYRLRKDQNKEYIPYYFKNSGKYLALALDYYQRASNYYPADPIIKCSHAMAAWALGKHGPMEALNNEPQAHLSTARELRSFAKENVTIDHELANQYFLKSLEEYKNAAGGGNDKDVKNNEFKFVEALNEFAYAFWQWRLLLPDQGDSQSVNGLAEYVEEYARFAISASINADDTTKAMVQSTLGEVLLGLARPQEAYEELERARKVMGAGADDPLVHEASWDLAQAYLCFVRNEEARMKKNGERTFSDQELDAMNKKAAGILQKIYNDEKGREYKPYMNSVSLLDPAYRLAACDRDNEKPEMSAELRPGASNNDSYSMGAPQYMRPVTCGWFGVQVETEDYEAPDPNDSTVTLTHPLVRIWGGGNNNRVAPKGEVTLGFEPRATYDYYFAQLEDQSHKALSKVFVIPTKENCDSNKIMLNFKRDPKLGLSTSMPQP